MELRWAPLLPCSPAANTDSAYRTLRPDRQYGPIDSTRLTVVTDVQKTVLQTLGAVERSR
jgi:hypothetical protein